MSHGGEHECGVEEGYGADVGGGVWEDGLLERAFVGLEGATGAWGVVAAAVGGFFPLQDGLLETINSVPADPWGFQAGHVFISIHCFSHHEPHL